MYFIQNTVLIFFKQQQFLFTTHLLWFDFWRQIILTSLDFVFVCLSYMDMWTWTCCGWKDCHEISDLHFLKLSTHSCLKDISKCSKILSGQSSQNHNNLLIQYISVCTMRKMSSVCAPHVELSINKISKIQLKKKLKKKKALNLWNISCFILAQTLLIFWWISVF